MDWSTYRLSTRLALPAPETEKVFSAIAEIDAVKNVWRITEADKSGQF